MNSQDWPESFIRAVCGVIRKRREEMGLSVYYVSQNSGVSQQAIGYIEKGMRRPSFESLVRISKGMNLKLSEIIAEAESGWKR
ncbi:helix-turn-helix transcriptional regulator [Luteolibacter sp. LG18]|uniref:helix-turn-helix domain-containing protein n=1 Tax=Luteolibacter sp. LG18 TaxID=2819286 RepID=UPI002B2F3F56|nr:hypothetical protein llg_43090 [Luteolibacter sp. LG18]